MTNLSEHWEEERAALVIAHPGHELRIHHWLERARPIVFILTDGSGHANHPRTESTAALVERTGARCSRTFGAISDRQLYRAILTGQCDLFATLAEQLARELQREGVSYVVGDAIEGFNPGHDVCRLLLNTAVLLVEAATGRRLKNMEYLLEGAPQACSTEDPAESIVLDLDAGAFRRKMEAARRYPEMAGEIARALAVHDATAFRSECLRPVRYGFDIGGRLPQPCFYELYGERQVAAGVYTEVIRFRDHVAPVATYLARLAGSPDWS